MDGLDRCKASQQGVCMSSAEYKKLDPLEKFRLEARAARSKKDRNDLLTEDIRHLRVQKSLIEERQREENMLDNGVVNSVSAFRLHAEDREQFNSIYRDAESGCNLFTLMDQFGGSAKAPSPAVQELLEGAMVWDSDDSPLPECMQTICRNRDHFNNLLLFAGNGDTPTECFMATIIALSPFSVTWLRLARTSEGVPTQLENFGGFSVGSILPGSMPRYRITEEFLVDGEAPFHDAATLWVWDDFDITDDASIVRIASRAVAFNSFCRGFPSPKQTRNAPTPRAPKFKDASGYDAFLEEFPWLTADFLESSSRSSSSMPARNGASSSSGTRGASGTGDVAPDVLGVEPPEVADVGALMERLDEIRAEFSHDDAGDFFFYVSNRGGIWLAETHRKATDSATVFARSIARLFCDIYVWPKQKGFAHLKYGSMESSNKLAKEFARRGHWYVAIWVGIECEVGFVFTDEHRVPEDEEFIDWALTHEVDSVVIDAVSDIRSLWPSNR
jgi:hypothetical protein